MRCLNSHLFQRTQSAPAVPGKYDTQDTRPSTCFERKPFSIKQMRTTQHRRSLQNPSRFCKAKQNTQNQPTKTPNSTLFYIYTFLMYSTSVCVKQGHSILSVPQGPGRVGQLVLTASATLAEGWGSVPYVHAGGSQLSTIPPPGYVMSFSGMNTCVHINVQAHTHINKICACSLLRFFSVQYSFQQHPVAIEHLNCG